MVDGDRTSCGEETETLPTGAKYEFDMELLVVQGGISLYLISGLECIGMKQVFETDVYTSFLLFVA